MIWFRQDRLNPETSPPIIIILTQDIYNLTLTVENHARIVIAFKEGRIGNPYFAVWQPCVNMFMGVTPHYKRHDRWLRLQKMFCLTLTAAEPVSYLFPGKDWITNIFQTVLPRSKSIKSNRKGRENTQNIFCHVLKQKHNRSSMKNSKLNHGVNLCRKNEQNFGAVSVNVDYNSSLL